MNAAAAAPPAITAVVPAQPLCRDVPCRGCTPPDRRRRRAAPRLALFAGVVFRSSDYGAEPLGLVPFVSPAPAS